MTHGRITNALDRLNEEYKMAKSGFISGRGSGMTLFALKQAVKDSSYNRKRLYTNFPVKGASRVFIPSKEIQSQSENFKITTDEFVLFYGRSIASRLNCHYDGIQPVTGGPDLMQFTDNVTHSTTYGNSLEEVREKLEVMRRKFNENQKA